MTGRSVSDADLRSALGPPTRRKPDNRHAPPKAPVIPPEALEGVSAGEDTYTCKGCHVTSPRRRQRVRESAEGAYGVVGLVTIERCPNCGGGL